MKRTALPAAALALALAAALGFGLALGQDNPEPEARGADGPDLQKIMQAKLQNAQKVLAGIALEDFNRVHQNASDLLALTHQAEWNVIEQPDYQRYSSEFRRTLQSLINAADRQNIDSATLAYMQMTMSCVECHKFLRDREGAGKLSK